MHGELDLVDIRTYEANKHDSVSKDQQSPVAGANKLSQSGLRHLGYLLVTSKVGGSTSVEVTERLAVN
ncbi:hypothetical protein HanRHA438_Chr16g0777701 [Helianthus annuus]|nr:hypothetical protein HanRHA438_Chr16g0777701 [Helianthus annuus]